MSVLLALGAALCSSFSTLITKQGIRNVNSHVALLIRNIVTFLCTVTVAVIEKSSIAAVGLAGWPVAALLLSGIASGLAWMFYFKALQLGNVNQVSAMDNFSSVMTMLLAFLFLGEAMGPGKVLAMGLMGGGTLLMAVSTGEKKENRRWLLFSVLALLLASSSSILVKCALKEMDSTFVTCVRNLISIVIALGAVLSRRKEEKQPAISGRNWRALILSGCLIGVSSLCSYQALKLGEASVIVPIERGNLLLTVLLSRLCLKERLSRRNRQGLVLISMGTVLLLVV